MNIIRSQLDQFHGLSMHISGSKSTTRFLVNPATLFFHDTSHPSYVKTA